MTRTVGLAEYRDELFCAGDSGPHWGAFWVAADGRSASEACAMDEALVGPFEDGVNATRVFGRVVIEGEQQRFIKGGDDEHDDAPEFWEVQER